MILLRMSTPVLPAQWQGEDRVAVTLTFLTCEKPELTRSQISIKSVGSLRMSSKTTVSGPSSQCAGVSPPA